MRYLYLLPIILAAFYAHESRADLDDFMGCMELNRGRVSCDAELRHNYDLPVCEVGERPDALDPDCEVDPEMEAI